MHTPLATLTIPPISAETTALISRAMAETPDKGETRLPENPALLARLLTEPPLPDFATADLLHTCFDGFGPDLPSSRALLAVARQLARHFALPTRMPLTTVRAWRMLDSVLFEKEMAAQLSVIGRFILDWQKTQQTFLCLEHSEIELIEHLFESLHPGHHPQEMTEVLNFKVLSNRRQGLLRRIPHRLRKAAADPGRRDDVLELVNTTQAFLHAIATARHYQPIIDAAAASLEEVNKLAEKLVPAQPALPPPGADGQPLARITPVKMPASHVADQAASPMVAPSLPPPSPPPPSPPAVAQPPETAHRPSFTPVPARFPLGGGPRFGVGMTAISLGRSIASTSEPPLRTMLSSQPAAGTLGRRAAVPAFLSAPLPRLAGPSAAIALEAQPSVPRQTDGQVTPPMPEARPVAPAPAQPPAAAGGSITDLTVVPTAKRPPITQAVKRQSVMKVLRGESAAQVANGLGIRVSKLDEWVDAFIAAGAGALTPVPKPKRQRKTTAEPLTAELLRTKLAEVLATAQLIERAMTETLVRTGGRPILLPPPDQSDATGPGPAHPPRGRRRKA